VSRLIKSLAHLLPELVRTLFGGRVTVRFPFGPPELPTCYRGKVVVRPESCAGCGLCVRDCPTSAIELVRESREQFRLIHHHDQCACCGQCEDSCRHGAITLVNEFVPATARRDTLTWVAVERGTSTRQNLDEV
jgi:formate hydrogenlyase subunit 6/NADH:ubiquinone oxidoreductase subunit I